MIVSPIVLGIIFFGMFTPIAMLMRLSGRDELRLKFNHNASHWKIRNEPVKPESFKNQFYKGISNGVFKRTLSILACTKNYGSPLSFW